MATTKVQQTQLQIPDTRQELTIIQPKPKQYKEWQNTIDRCTTMKELEVMCTPLIVLTKKYKLVVVGKNGEREEPEAFRRMRVSGKKSKSNYEELAAMFLEPSTFEIYFRSLTPEMQELWRTAARNQCISIEDAEKIVGKKLASRMGYYYYDPELEPTIRGWFTSFRGKTRVSNRRYTTSCYVLGLQLELTCHLMPVIFSDEWKSVKGLATLPEDKNLKIFSGEDTIFAELPAIVALCESNKLEQNKNGRLAQAGLKNTAKSLGMAEFFPDDKDAKMAMLRAQLVLNVICNAISKKKGKKFSADEKVIKEAVAKVLGNGEFLVPVILTEVIGLRVSLYYNGDVDDALSAFYLTLFDTNNKHWRSFETLFLQTISENPEVDFFLFHSYDFDRVDINNKYSAKEVLTENFMEQMTRPLMRGLAFLFAALGMVEIAYRDPQVGDASPYDGLCYIRVTELGRYCAGRVKEYTSPDITKKQFFEVDEDKLFVKSLEETNPLLPVLASIADPITQRIYKVSYASFLRDCFASGDVDTRIKLFKQYVCSKPSEVWKTFFAEARRHFKPFTSVGTKYSLMQIPADNKELQRILLTDPIIRKYTIKAEGYLLLIDIAYQKQVADRLKTYGYVM